MPYKRHISGGRHNKQELKQWQEYKEEISDRCQFETERGSKCHEKSTKVVNGMKCCDYHAERKDAGDWFLK